MDSYDEFIKRVGNKTLEEINANGVIFKLKKPLHIEMMKDSSRNSYYAYCPELKIKRWGDYPTDASNKLEWDIMEMVAQRTRVKLDYARLMVLREDYFDFDGSRSEREGEHLRYCGKCHELYPELVSLVNEGICPVCGDIFLETNR